ncbi:hypothetical protein SVAN01_01267 [Stagonosporopsis vannaccii]|nr:hypothetical protein SVAN01_01267 [Stagonosporopsis vannaccii]
MADIFQELGIPRDDASRLLAKTPVMTPPAGITPNFVDPPTRAALQIWTISVFFAIAVIIYANRLYVKAKMMKSWSWDDVTLAITAMLAIAQYSLMVGGVTQSIMGRHLWDISVVQMFDSRLPPIAYSLIILTPLTLLFLKTTFFLLYLHLFSRIRWVRISCWIGVCYVVLSMGSVAIYAFVIANPHENVSWSSKATQLGVPVGVLSLIADLVIFVIPFAAIIPLQINRAKRVGALLIFLTGGSAVICAICNIYYRCRLQNSRDPLWDGVLGSIFSLCEVLLGITCACLPAAVYGFRQKGTVYHRALHPSLYLSSKLASTTILTSSTPQRSGTADAELSISRSRIRRTTYVEISTSEPEHGLDAKDSPSPINQKYAKEQTFDTLELRPLDPAHLSTPDEVHRRG